ncbi:radical SAM protein [bacterium]|nr:radical SAM protein [bacterium]
MDCSCCPRECCVDRSSERLGFCQSGTGFSVGSVCTHFGEEPVLCGETGICNIFFTRCNMQCIFCQNYQISRNREKIIERELELSEILEKIEKILAKGVKCVGFVSPSHFIPQMKVIISALKFRGKKPRFVMNTNCYDKIETIRSLENEIAVYLPDLKYLDGNLAKNYSKTPDYPEVAKKALKEMFRQKGSNILLDDDGIIENGLIIRHLVLPNQVKNSIDCLRFIAEELSPSVHVSLMAQFCPTEKTKNHSNLGRFLHKEEYEEVLEEFEKLGFYRGWTQELGSSTFYQPDFFKKHPFED